MHRFVFCWSILGLFFVIGAVCFASETPNVREYAVRWTGFPPIVDGIIGSEEGEWSEASSASTDFVVLETGEASPADLSVSFRAVYDGSYLYFLVETQDTNLFSILATGDDSLTDEEDQEGTDTGAFYSSLGDDLEILFDPGPDILRNNHPPSDTPDQYHIAVTLDTTHGIPELGFPGFPDLKRDVEEEQGPPFQFSAAGYDLALRDGDPDLWDPAMQIGIRVHPDVYTPNGAVVELAVPFADLDFSGDRQVPPVNATNGQPDRSLVVEEVPKHGDRWAFQIGRLTNEGITLVWNRPTVESLLARPFGELVFVREETGVADWFLY